MTIDAKGLAAAINMFHKLSAHDGDSEALFTDILTAYEAALWKPIEELADCKAKQILLCGKGPDYIVARRDTKLFWWNGHDVTKLPVNHFRPLPKPPK